MASAVYTATPSQWASAATHLDQREAWRTVRIDGVRYVVLVSGNSGRVYMVRADARGCGCLWSERAATPCSHRLAVELAALEDELAEAAVHPSPALTPRLTADDLWPACAAGCGDLVDRLGETCWTCLSNDTRRLDEARRRGLVGSR